MADFVEIDFLEAGENDNGDAIALRYGMHGAEWVHIVDGGYAKDGDALVDHVRKYYQPGDFIDHVVLTHPDGDHAAGLHRVLEEFDVGVLWMNRPWSHLGDLRQRFEYAYTENGLRQRLRKNFPHTAALEDLADAQGIEVRDALQGTRIGEFTVLAPSLDRYLDLIVEDDKTPEPAKDAVSLAVNKVWETIATFAKSVWGVENLKGGPGATSRRNEASIVQFAEICDRRILLTGDAGVEALEDAMNFADWMGHNVYRPNWFQVPHHGSRRNVSSETLDRLLGEKLGSEMTDPADFAIVSVNRQKDGHPRKAVVRAMTHRGYATKTTKQSGFCIGKNVTDRPGWFPAPSLPYPQDQEDD